MRLSKRAMLLGASGVAVLSLAGAAVFAVQPRAAHAASISGITRQISSIGASSFDSAAPGGDVAVQSVEFPGTVGEDASGTGGSNSTFRGVDRSNSGATTGNGRQVSDSKPAKSNPVLNGGFQGLNLYQQRFANGGNQYTVEPPDQGLCVGNGYILESVNDVLAVYDTTGNTLKGPVDLNTFYGYQAAINRHTFVRGPFVTDPVCAYDQTTGRFVQVVLTLDTRPNGSYTGNNHLDIAVSNSSDPTGTWTIYKLPVQDNGTDGTPDHHCTGGFCFGDYPHIGVDRNGVYLTTNEYEFFGDAYIGAQIYAISNAQLASGASSISVTQFDTSTAAPGGKPGFTVWPAQSPATQFADDNGGTEYFLSSTAADEAQCDSGVVCSGTGTSNTIVLWSLANTSSLASNSPTLTLANSALTVDQYAMPPKANQKAGDYPQGQLSGRPEGVLDTNDTRMQQVTYANGKVWGALDTDVIVGGQHKAGIAYYVVNPGSSKLALQGTLALANNNLSYPAIGVLENGRGVMAFTVSGDDYYPSAGYAGIDALVGAGDVQIAAAGAGPTDGFTEYGGRPRWGDYGATAVDGNTIWMASEYIAQTCTVAQYQADRTCGHTRAPLGNWSTRISQVTP